MVKEKMLLQRLIANKSDQILASWVKELTASNRLRNIRENELQAQCAEFMQLLKDALRDAKDADIQTSEWEPVRKFLAEVSRLRSNLGFTPTETAMFVFSLKQPIFNALREELSKDNSINVVEEMWSISTLFDRLGLYTTEIYQKAREEVINRQQQDMLELSTPVVNLADNILALPLIGTLDSARTQVVMESLLQRIVETGSSVAIIDITGVPTVDTLVAQHLLKTVTAARLMGADCIISGIRPQIAQTIVHLGVELGNVVTKATLAAAFKVALERNNMAITHISKKPERN